MVFSIPLPFFENNMLKSTASQAILCSNLTHSYFAGVDMRYRKIANAFQFHLV